MRVRSPYPQTPTRTRARTRTLTWTLTLTHPIPHPRRARRCVAVGLNPLELAANPSKTEWRVQDLNKKPKLPCADATLDMQPCVCSLQPGVCSLQPYVSRL